MHRRTWVAAAVTAVATLASPTLWAQSKEIRIAHVYSRTGPLKWVGTGPFVIQSFSPGQQSVANRNKNYWRTGQPYFDSVTVIDYAEATAQVNALLSGQLDAITDIPFAQIDVAKSNGGFAILVTQGGGWLPLCMAIDMPPFDDNRVRQAMRLIVD